MNTKDQKKFWKKKKREEKRKHLAESHATVDPAEVQHKRQKGLLLLGVLGFMVVVASAFIFINMS
jgi:hypothetical protein